jgi:hypothetical protein
MRKIYQTTALAAGMLCMFAGTSAFAASDADVELLKQQVQALIAQNQELTKRITAMEKMQTGSTASAAPESELSPALPASLIHTHVHTKVQKEMRKQRAEAGNEQKINDYVTLFGLVEGEAVFGEDFEGNSFSAFNVATVELGLNAQLSEWATAHLLALYEGPDDDLAIDEATIWLGNYEKFPLLMTTGKFYMPFGSFETNMIQDPLTLEIGEINDYGLAVGLLGKGFFGALYSYNGIKETGSSDTIEGFGAEAGYSFENDSMSFKTGISWVNNIANAGTIADHFEVSGMDSIEKQINGIGVHLLAGFGPVSFIGEYIQALDDFAEISFMDHGAEPKAWNTEFAYSAELFGKASNFAIAYQGTSESVELDLPEARYLAAASMILFQGTALTLEYSHDKDYGIAEGGTDEDANVFSTQLAYEF